MYVRCKKICMALKIYFQKYISCSLNIFICAFFVYLKSIRNIYEQIISIIIIYHMSNDTVITHMVMKNLIFSKCHEFPKPGRIKSTEADWCVTEGRFWLGRWCGLYLTSVNPEERQTQALITNSHSLPSLQSALMNIMSYKVCLNVN